MNRTRLTDTEQTAGCQGAGGEEAGGCIEFGISVTGEQRGPAVTHGEL